MLSQKQLRSYLAYSILGKKSPSVDRKPPAKAKRFSTRKGPPRDEVYKTWIRTLPSIVSGLMLCEACHTGDDGGMSMKASDYSCVPLTTEEHREYHRVGKAAFEQGYGLNFARACKALTTEWRRCA